MMVTSAGQRVGRRGFSRVMGNGSKLLDVVLDLVMRSRTWSASSREKVEKHCGGQADGWCVSCTPPIRVVVHLEGRGGG